MKVDQKIFDNAFKYVNLSFTPDISSLVNVVVDWAVSVAVSFDLLCAPRTLIPESSFHPHRRHKGVVQVLYIMQCPFINSTARFNIIQPEGTLRHN
jgi:hypothetical protein